MSGVIILAEIVILTILFTVAVVTDSREPVNTVYDMPKPIIDRCLELGLIDETKKADSPQTRRKKTVCSACCGCDHDVCAYLCESCRELCTGVWHFLFCMAGD